MAYRANRSVLSYLDHREKDGYTTHHVTFHPHNESTPPFTVLVYIATETNVEYLGPAPPDVIARHVAESRGPSGCNVEYVMNLARTIRELMPQANDQHLFDIESRLREILTNSHLSSQHDVDSKTLPTCNSCEYHSRAH